MVILIKYLILIHLACIGGYDNFIEDVLIDLKCSKLFLDKIYDDSSKKKGFFSTIELSNNVWKNQIYNILGKFVFIVNDIKHLINFLRDKGYIVYNGYSVNGNYEPDFWDKDKNYRNSLYNDIYLYIRKKIRI